MSIKYIVYDKENNKHYYMNTYATITKKFDLSREIIRRMLNKEYTIYSHKFSIIHIPHNFSIIHNPQEEIDEQKTKKYIVEDKETNKLYYVNTYDDMIKNFDLTYHIIHRILNKENTTQSHKFSIIKNPNYEGYKCDEPIKKRKYKYKLFDKETKKTSFPTNQTKIAHILGIGGNTINNIIKLNRYIIISDKYELTITPIE